MEKDFTPGRPLRAYHKDRFYTDFSTDLLVGANLHHFKGWFCGQGIENLYIDMDGVVYGASCRQGGSLGNIFEDIQIAQNWSPCQKTACSCGADLFIPKARRLSDKQRLVKTFASTDKSVESQALAQTEFVGMERTHSSNLKQVYWELGRWCNYDCSYCWPFIHNKTDPHKSLDQLIRGTLLLDEKFARGANCHFIISGGEPTMNPALMDWVKFMSSLGHHVSMHSNGSRLPGYYKELIHYTHLNLSLHFEFYKQDRFLAVIAEVLAEKVRVKNKNIGHLEIKIMMSPGRTQEALDVEKMIFALPNFANYCTLAIVPIRDGSRGDLIKEGYVDDDFKLFGDRQNFV